MPLPDDSLADLQTDFAAGLLDPDRPVPDRLRSPAGGSADRRYAVYRNNVVGGLVDALAETFPASLNLVGDAFFRAAAATFVRAHPPGSALLLHYGGGLPAFLRGFPPAAGVPYLGDVAELEWAQAEAFHAPDAAPVPVDALGAVPQEALADTGLALHPSLRLISSSYPVVALWADLLGRPGAEDVDLRHGEDALVLRPGWQVEVTALPPGSATFLSALSAGAGLATAAGEAADAATHTGFDLGTHLAGLFQAGCFVGLRSAET